MKRFIFEEITKKVGAFKDSRIILTANELNVFTHIQKGLNTAEIMARKIRADKNSLTRLLNALCAIKLLNKKGDKYRNTALSARFLAEGGRDYLGHTLLHHSNMWNKWSELTETVKLGQRVKNHALVKDRSNKEKLTAFVMAMHNNAKYKARYLAQKIKISNVRTGRRRLVATLSLLDLGGGPGTYAVYFAKKNKNLNCVVYDAPEVIKISEKIIKKYNMQSRVKTVAGDFLQNPIPAGFDAVFLSSIIHIYNEEENTALFKKIYSSLNDGGKIIIKDYILDDNKITPPYAAVFSVHMMVATKTGGVYTEKEVFSALKKAGFKNIKRRDILDFSLITGEKKNHREHRVV